MVTNLQRDGRKLRRIIKNGEQKISVYIFNNYSRRK